MGNARNNILLNPGPVNLSQAVKQAMNHEDVCHREIEFGELVQSINERLIKIYPSLDKFKAVLLSCSGTGAVEAMISSFINQGKTLAISNGVYGQRMEKILDIYKKPYEAIEFDLDHEIDLARLENQLKSDREISNMTLVHHETTTGRLNSLNSIGQLCKDYDVKLFLDAVSSFGAEEIQANAINLAAVAASANKCLHGAPGASFVIAHQDLWNHEPDQASSVYFDLYEYYKLQQDQGFSPFTQATHVLHAFDVALDEFFQQGGWDSRNAEYSEKASRIMRTLSKLGIEPLIKAEDFSCVLHSYLLPTEHSYDDLHRFMKKNGFIIYQGQGDLSDRIFRISTMGEISTSDVTRLCDLFVKYFDNLND